LIVADTSAIVALIDRTDDYHERVLALFRDDPDRWILPWAILPEVAYLIGRQGGYQVEQVFLDDVATDRYHVDWGREGDLARASELNRQYASLAFGLVDAVVMATAERLKAPAIATLDRRHFGAVTLRGMPALVPVVEGRRAVPRRRARR
jgi:predicted nucleic acid-binding protein